jgi:putative peptide zinc metalloprotease protein
MEKIDYTTIIPTIRKKFTVVKKENHKVLIIIEGATKNSYLYCDQEIVSILELVDGKDALSDINNKLQNVDIQISIEDLHDTLFNKFNKLVTDNDIEKQSNGFLFLNFVLINEKKVKKIASHFSFIFKSEKFVFSSFTFFIFLTGYILFFTKRNFDITSQSILILPVISLVVLIFHEIGHATACYTYGAKNGPIGFGFYLLTPVMYADVTDSWKLTKDKRLLIDIAGLYMEGLIMTIFTVIYYLSGIDFFLYVAIVIIFNTVININPFLKFDGYWILCDLTNTYNLRELSDRNLIDLLKLKTKAFKASNYLFAFYALLNFLFLGWFLFYMTYFRFMDLVEFPINIFLYIKSWILQTPNSISFWQISLPIGFYLILLNKLKTLYIYAKNKYRTKR